MQYVRCASCPYLNVLSGYCKLTACVMKSEFSSTISTDTLVPYDDETCVMLPQTIGNITFYTKKELFEWVLEQQKNNLERILKNND